MLGHSGGVERLEDASLDAIGSPQMLVDDNRVILGVLHADGLDLIL